MYTHFIPPLPELRNILTLTISIDMPLLMELLSENVFCGSKHSFFISSSKTTGFQFRDFGF